MPTTGRDLPARPVNVFVPLTDVPCVVRIGERDLARIITALRTSKDPEVPEWPAYMADILEHGDPLAHD